VQSTREAGGYPLQRRENPYSVVNLASPKKILNGLERRRKEE
jgi:hypothetical protein